MEPIKHDLICSTYIVDEDNLTSIREQLASALAQTNSKIEIDNPQDRQRMDSLGALTHNKISYVIRCGYGITVIADDKGTLAIRVLPPHKLERLV